MTPAVGICAHHEMMVQGKTFWTVVTLLVGIFGAIVAYSNATFASADRVDGVERRAEDMRSMMRDGFARQDKQNEAISSKLDAILAAKKGAQ